MISDMINARIETKRLTRTLSDIERKQMPYAAMLALNETAKDGQRAEQQDVVRVFNNPTKWTINGFRVSRATKTRLTSKVFFKDEYQGSRGSNAWEYLTPHVGGGERRFKGSEVLFMRAGVLPPGMFMVPASAAEYDAYGNVKRVQINKLLSYFRAFPEAGYKANITDAKKQRMARGTKRSYGVAYFVGRPGGGPLGIWQRTQSGFGSAVKPVFIFVSAVTYQRRFDFHGVVETTYDKRFILNLKRGLDRALGTARR